MQPLRRVSNPERANWEALIYEQGLTFHSAAMPYWREDAHYRVSLGLVTRLMQATDRLHAMCLEAVRCVIAERRYTQLGLPAWAEPLIVQSWMADTPSIIGRFDLAVDPQTLDVRMLEYNADTPTSLLEAGRIQRLWRDTLFPGYDQWNTIEGDLIAAWKHAKQWSRQHRLFCMSMPDQEDIANVVYTAMAAASAGWEVQSGFVSDVTYEDGRFRGPLGERLDVISKLYPWEWLLDDPACESIDLRRETWLEPPWKMILSSKGILPLLWELFPGHPNLLAAGYGAPPAHIEAHVRKPVWSREGQNIIRTDASGNVESRPGEYGENPWIWQELAVIPSFDPWHPVIGSWVIGGVSAGIGIRESWGPITDNRSLFVPHIVDPATANFGGGVEEDL